MRGDGASRRRARLHADDVPRAEAAAAADQKKDHHASELDEPEVALKRARYQALIVAWALSRLKFVDETGVNLTLTRRYGRAAPGLRVREGVPRRYIKHVTLVAAVGLAGLVAPMTLDGAMDAEAFVEWVEQVLAPCLSTGDVVVMDNLSVHKVEAVVAAITARGAYVEFLPPYSPDLNPIEKVWSKLKTALRKAKARTREALDVALRDAIATLTTSDIRGWFEHCGYVIR